MSHPDYEILSAYLDGQLTDEERLRAERLLEEDAEARHLLEELREVSRTVSALPRHALPDDFVKQIETSLTVQPRTKKIDWQNLRRRYLSGRSLTWVAIVVVAAFGLHLFSPDQNHQVARDNERDEVSEATRDRRPMATLEMSAAKTDSDSAATEQEGVAASHMKQEAHSTNNGQSVDANERDNAEHLRKTAVPGVDKLAGTHHADHGGKLHRGEKYLEVGPGKVPMSERLDDQNAAAPKRTFAMEGAPPLLAAPQTTREEKGVRSPKDTKDKGQGERFVNNERPIAPHVLQASPPREDKAALPSHDGSQKMAKNAPSGSAGGMGRPPRGGFGGMSNSMTPPPRAWRPKEAAKTQEDLPDKSVAQSQTDSALPGDVESVKPDSKSRLEIVVICEVKKPAEVAHEFDRLLARSRVASEEQNGSKNGPLALSGEAPTKNQPGEEKAYGTSRIAPGDGAEPKDTSKKWKDLLPTGKERTVELQWDEAVRLLKALEQDKRQIISIQADASPQLTLPGSLSRFNRKSNADTFASKPEIPAEATKTATAQTPGQPGHDLQKKDEHRLAKPPVPTEGKAPTAYRLRFIFRPVSP